MIGVEAGKLLLRCLAPLGCVGGVLAWAEWVHWRASGRLMGTSETRDGGEAVVVLGFKNRGVRANYVNRYRVRAALRSVEATAERSVLVFCGGAVGGAVPEAELMARYARDECGYTGPFRLDADSASTWENIRNAAGFLEGFGTIKIVSNSLHAEKGRAYLWKQRPDLAARLVRADEYHLGEATLVKPIAVFASLKSRRRVMGSVRRTSV